MHSTGMFAICKLLRGRGGGGGSYVEVGVAHDGVVDSTSWYHERLAHDLAG